MSSMKISQLATLKAMGIEAWQLRSPMAKLMLLDVYPATTTDKASQDLTNKLLAAWLNLIDLAKDEIIVVKISAEEINQQIKKIQPKLIITLGENSAHKLLNTTDLLDNLRQKIHSDLISNISIINTYHPQDLLTNPINKKLSWQDLQLINKTLKTLT